MSDYSFSITESFDEYNNLVLRAARALSEQEEEQLRAMLVAAWDDGFNQGCHYASADLSHATYRAQPPANPYRLGK